MTNTADLTDIVQCQMIKRDSHNGKDE